jgi:hypothetical protein
MKIFPSVLALGLLAAVSAAGAAQMADVFSAVKQVVPVRVAKDADGQPQVETTQEPVPWRIYEVACGEGPACWSVTFIMEAPGIKADLETLNRLNESMRYAKATTGLNDQPTLKMDVLIGSTLDSKKLIYLTRYWVRHTKRFAEAFQLKAK